jgi:hypothetical protein
MRRTIATACVLVMISGGLWAQQSGGQTASPPPAQTARKKRAPDRKKGKAVSEPLPAQIMPPVPANLMNSEPVMPNVTMEDGLLTIDAPNSTLSDVLSEVHKATGASIEGASPSERVAVRLGPGNPGQVIAALLTGTRYDYVILGSPEKQDTVTRVLLTQSSQGAASDGSTGSTKRPPAGAGPHRPHAIGMRQLPEDSSPESTVSDDTTALPDTTIEQTPPQQQDLNLPKTPEQLFRESQQMDQQKPK